MQAAPNADSTYTPPPIVRWFRIAGRALLLLAVFLLVQEIWFVRHAAHAQGEILSFNPTDMPRQSQPSFSTTFAYTMAAGQRVQVTTKLASGPEYFAGTVGATIPVLYSPAHPKHAIPDTWMDKWFASVLTAGSGVFFLVFAAVLNYGFSRSSSRITVGKT